MAATGSAASALCTSLAASSPGLPSCPLPSARTCIGRRGFSTVGDWGPRTWNLRAERVGGKRRDDLSPGAPGTRGPAPRRPDPDRGSAGGGARGRSPRGPSPRGSRLLTPAVNSPGVDAQRTFGKRRKLRSARPLGLHRTLLAGCRLRSKPVPLPRALVQGHQLSPRLRFGATFHLLARSVTAAPKLIPIQVLSCSQTHLPSPSIIILILCPFLGYNCEPLSA